MKTSDSTRRELTFCAKGCDPVSCLVSPNVPLGEVAASVAARWDMAGTFECLNSKCETLSPETPIADLPDEEITLASELTPAR